MSLEMTMPAPRENPAKSRRIDYSNEFKVVVGAELGQQTKTYTIAKDVLVQSSKFFRAACSKQWNEESKTIELADQSSSTFEMYLQWLHTGNIVVSDREPEPVDTTRLAETSRPWVEELWLLVRVYLLAEMLLDIPAKNAAMDALLKDNKRYNNAATDARLNNTTIYPYIMSLMSLAPILKEVYEGTTDASPMRRLLVDIDCAFMRADRSRMLGYPHELAVDISVNFMKLRDERKRPADPRTTPKCFYHEHNEEFAECAR